MIVSPRIPDIAFLFLGTNEEQMKLRYALRRQGKDFSPKATYPMGLFPFN